MRTVVTGGAGFIGSHVAEALAGANGGKAHQVLVIDDLSRGKRENVPPKAEFAKLDITTAEAERAVLEYAPEAVFHHAAQMDVRKSVVDPAYDCEVNVAGTARMLTAAARCGTRIFVFASTGGAIYGEQESFPASERHRTRPESPYGLSKLCAEFYLAYFSRAAGMRTVALRYANVYGPRQDPHGEAGVVAIFAEKMLCGGSPTVFGDGEQTRDYVAVGDVARANLLALACPAAAGAYNIGTGVETSVNRLARILAEASGYQGPIHHGQALPGEQRRSVIACAKAEQELGWKPEIALEEGLRATLDWFRRRHDA